MSWIDEIDNDYGPGTAQAALREMAQATPTPAQSSNRQDNWLTGLPTELAESLARDLGEPRAAQPASPDRVRRLTAADLLGPTEAIDGGWRLHEVQQ